MNGFCVQSLMTFEELSRDLSNSYTYSKKDDSDRKIPFATIPSTSGCDSSNDILIGFLTRHSFPHLRNFNGTVWFVFEGEWVRTVSKYCEETSSFSYYIK